MKFFFYSKEADCAGMALRVKEEGNDVRLYVKDAYARDTLKGLVEQVLSPAEGLAFKPDCIVFDMVGSGKLADAWVKSGYNVIGASSFHDKLEYDRAFAMKFADKLGIKVPPYSSFTSAKDAIKFVEKSEKRYVLKPDDNAGGTALTYVSRGADDMVRFLEWADKKSGAALNSFILQEFVKGIEISTEVWFSKGNPVYPTNGTMELKKFMPGDVGPNTGCMASVVWPYHPKEPRIVQQTVKKMYPALKAIKFTGPLDVNSLVDEQGKAWFLEFTPRFGYSAIYAMTELLNQDLAKVLHDCATEKLSKINMREEFGMALRVTVPPYPLGGSTEHRKIFQETAGRTISNLPAATVIFLMPRKKTENL